MERSRKSQTGGRLAAWPVAAVAAAVSTLVLAGPGVAGTPVLSVGEIEAVALVASPPLAAAASVGATTVAVGPGASVVVCHVAAGANVLGVPVLVRTSELRAFLLANPKDTLGACASHRAGTIAGSSGAGTVAREGAGQPQGEGDGSEAGGAAGAPCADRLLIADVQAAPLVIRSVRQPLLVRLVVRTGCGTPVPGAFVTLRSTPLGNIARTMVQKTAADGSVVFASTTTKRLRLVRGGRLVLFAQAVRPGETTLGCATGRRLVSVRTSPAAR